MSNTYDHTDNYNLDLYGDKDPADLRDGHNHNMHLIDDGLKAHSDAIANTRDKLQELKARTEQELADRPRRAEVYTKGEADGKFETIANADATADNNNQIHNNLTQQIANVKTELEQSIINQSADGHTALNILHGDGNGGLTRPSDMSALIDRVNHKVDYKPKRVICIGDSWGRAFDGGNHDDESPFNTMMYNVQRYWDVASFENHSINASGIVARGDGGKNWTDAWNEVGSKNTVTDIVLLGGQNDATISDIDSDKIRAAVVSFVDTVQNGAGERVHVWIFPMPLAPGQKMHGADGVHNTKRAMVYDGFLRGAAERWNCIAFQGCYRWSEHTPWIGNGDNAHLKHNEYWHIGKIMSDCLITGQSYYPYNTDQGNNSSILGTWRYDEIVENNGIITVSFCCDYGAKPAEGAVVFTLPEWARSWVPRYRPCSNFNGNCFFALDGDSVRIYGTNAMSETGTISMDATWQAGY